MSIRRDNRGKLPLGAALLGLLVVLILACSPAASPTAAPAQSSGSQPGAATQAPGGEPASTSVPAAAQPGEMTKVTIFTGPTPLYDSVWMADQQGYFKEVGIEPVFRTFPSGTTALETFKTGEGDIVFNGDLPGINYWLNNNKDYRVIGVIARDVKGLAAIARNEIQQAQDLKGKTVGTRVGSTGSYFIDTYLKKNGMQPTDVTVKNLDPQVLVTAVCQGDIDAFFIWQPFPERALEVCQDSVHYLTYAEGYVRNYALAGVRPDYLEQNMTTVENFLKAVRKGAEYAENNLADVQKYAQEAYSLSAEATEFQWEIQERPWTLDQTFYDDFAQESEWMIETGLTTEKLDFTTFVDTRPLEAIGAEFVKVPAAQ